MFQQWQALFNQLEIIDEGAEIPSKEEILAFETENNILLPTGYKEFCQVFGTGGFESSIRIFSPKQDLLDYSTLSSESIREYIQLFPSENLDRDNNLTRLLENSFVFGDDYGANIAIWDLRTYSDLDESYDIYWVDIDAADEVLYQVGRDFFDFVNNFCLGQGTYELLPEDKHPPTGNVPQVFTQFSSR